MSEGRRLDRQRPPLCADRTASEARRPGSGSRARGVSRAARGNDGSPNGARRRRRLDAQHDSATGHVSLAGDALNSMFGEHHAQDSPPAQGIEELVLLLGLRLVSGRSGAAGSAVFEGRQASRGGDRPKGFPLEASEARSVAGAKASTSGAAKGKARRPRGRRARLSARD